MDVQDREPAGLVGRRDLDLAGEASGPQQRRVERVEPVGRADDDDARTRVKAVELGEQLVERVVRLAAAAVAAARSPTADRVDLVDEDDRAVLAAARLREELADALGADADVLLDEVRSGDGEERHAGLAGERLGEQRLARARRAVEDDAGRHLRADLLKRLGLAQEGHELGDLLDGLVAAGDVGELHRRERAGLARLALRAARARVTAAGRLAAAARLPKEAETADEDHRAARPRSAGGPTR